MFRPVRRHFALLACGLLTVLVGVGCDRLRPGDTDERREANFQSAYNLALQGLTDDAMKGYYHALEANPHNATAHRELGQIYLDRKHDFVMAVYHFRRCQQIRTNRNDREANDYSIEQAIKQSQLQLAVEFNGQIGRQQAQSQFDDLKRRNAELEATVARLSQQAGLKAQANPHVPSSPPPTILEPPSRPLVTDPRRVESPPTDRRVTAAKSEGAVAKPAGSPRTHVIKSGETPAAIARQYGLTATQLMAVNKGVDAHRLRPGQVLNLPEKAR